MSRQDLRILAQLVRPELLVEGVLLFGLGSAVARYLGREIPAQNYLLGQGIILTLQLSAHLLVTFFAHQGNRLRPERRVLNPLDHKKTTEIPLRSLLFVSAALLTLSATAGSLLMLEGALGLAASLLLLGIVGGIAAYTIPPFRVRRGGFGELLAAFLLGAGIPSFAFTLHTGELHRLVLMATVPIVATLFAVLVANDLTTYAQDVKEGRKTFMVQVGWMSGMRIHDVALVLGFVFLIVGYLLGLPRRVALGSMLTLPLGLAQIWYLSRLREGAPTRWAVLRANSIGLVGLMTYLELAGFLLS